MGQGNFLRSTTFSPHDALYDDLGAQYCAIYPMIGAFRTNIEELSAKYGVRTVHCKQDCAPSWGNELGRHCWGSLPVMGLVDWGEELWGEGMRNVDHMDGTWTAQTLINTDFVQVVQVVHINIDISNKFCLSLLCLTPALLVCTLCGSYENAWTAWTSWQLTVS